MSDTSIFYHTGTPPQSQRMGPIENHVLGHMFGQAMPAGPNVSRFMPDPAIARCSLSLRALHSPNGFAVPTDQLLELKSSGPTATRVLKATLAQMMLDQWEAGYARVLDRTTAVPGERTLIGGGPLEQVLGRVPKDVLLTSVEAEREIARAGVAAIIEEMEVEPVWLRVELPGQPAIWNAVMDRWQLSTDFPPLLPDATLSAPQQTSRRTPGVINEHAQAPATDSPREGFFDLTLDVPLYLPKTRGFFGMGEAHAPEGIDALAAAREVLATVAGNPDLQARLVHAAHITQVDFVQEFPRIADLDNDDDDWDDDDENWDDEDTNPPAQRPGY